MSKSSGEVVVRDADNAEKLLAALFNTRNEAVRLDRKERNPALVGMVEVSVDSVLVVTWTYFFVNINGWSPKHSSGDADNRNLRSERAPGVEGPFHDNVDEPSSDSNEGTDSDEVDRTERVEALSSNSSGGLSNAQRAGFEGRRGIDTVSSPSGPKIKALSSIPSSPSNDSR